MQKVGVHACTDITGFGLLGHAVQLAKNSGISDEIRKTGLKDAAIIGEVTGESSGFITVR